MKSYRITAKSLPNGWVEGSINGLRFQAKVYDEGSKFGIEQGRVSKLSVTDGNNRTLIDYERGWKQQPEDVEHQNILQILLLYFNYFPTSAYWETLSAEEPFIATVRLSDGSWIKAKIHVSSDGSGTIEDARTGRICGALNPVDVWELKMQEDAGYVPNYEYPLIEKDTELPKSHLLS